MQILKCFGVDPDLHASIEDGNRVTALIVKHEGNFEITVCMLNPGSNHGEAFVEHSFVVG
jgi:hypothetical protein